jgi:hypothetical protein
MARLAAATKKLAKERFVGVTAKQLGGWYGQVVADLHRANRLKGQKPRSLALAPAIAPFVESRRSFDAAAGVDLGFALPREPLQIGGVPRAGGDAIPKNPLSRDPMVHLLSLKEGDLGWSKVLNDADGALHVYATHVEPFGVVTLEAD